MGKWYFTKRTVLYIRYVQYMIIMRARQLASQSACLDPVTLLELFRRFHSVL